ncbi:hypothetical protein LTR10_006573 [Elasticomyces elasticus]|nr:hypothetical protein LTR10_006573 [Elasticomyces elasticus]KAK4973024.1 hypothetical protein LTR42_006318 [Elasticomyces elasticus]
MRRKMPAQMTPSGAPETGPKTSEECDSWAVLKAEIEDAIKPYTTPGAKKPLYPVGQLVVMATTCSLEPEITDTSILRWILKTFPFYSEEALAAYITASQPRGYGAYGRVEQVVPGITEALGCYDIPLRILTNPTTSQPTYSAPVSPARSYLCDLLEPKRKGAFPFFELPPELRNTVYEMLLLFDDRGFTVRKGRGKVSLRLPCREIDYKPKVNSSPGPARLELFEAPPLTKILAVVRTCKQIYAEAMPYFYRDNRFNFETADCLATTLPCLPSSRVQHLSSLHLTISTAYGIRTDFSSALNELMNVKTLKRLELELDESDNGLLNMRTYERKRMGVERSRPFANFGQIPCLPLLALVASKAEELILSGEGDCPKLRKYLEDEVRRLKRVEAETVKEVEAEAASGKRKRASSSKISEVPKKRTKRQEAMAANAKVKA